MREVWGVWGTILAPIGWVGRGNGSGAGNWRANGASNGSLWGGGARSNPKKVERPGPTHARFLIILLLQLASLFSELLSLIL